MRSSPAVLLVVSEVLAVEELAELVLEGFGAVVFALVLDVGGDGIEIGLEGGEDAVAESTSALIAMRLLSSHGSLLGKERGDQGDDRSVSLPRLAVCSGFGILG